MEIINTNAMLWSSLMLGFGLTSICCQALSLGQIDRFKLKVGLNVAVAVTAAGAAVCGFLSGSYVAMLLWIGCTLNDTHRVRSNFKARTRRRAAEAQWETRYQAQEAVLSGLEDMSRQIAGAASRRHEERLEAPRIPEDGRRYMQE